MYLVIVQRDVYGSEWETKTVTHEFKGRSGARKARECYSSFLQQAGETGSFPLVQLWHKDDRLHIDEEVSRWERP